MVGLKRGWHRHTTSSDTASRTPYMQATIRFRLEYQASWAMLYSRILVGVDLMAIVLLVDVGAAALMGHTTIVRSVCQSAGFWNDGPGFGEVHAWDADQERT